MARPDYRSQRAHVRKSSIKEDKGNDSATTLSISEEDSGYFESILSTMCCRSSSSSALYSRSKEIVGKDDREVKNENYFWDEMRSFFLYVIRPVAYITIDETSVGSELTLPHVLVRMAEKHDKQNAHEVLSKIQGDNNSKVLSNSSSFSTNKSRDSFVKLVKSRTLKKYYKGGNKKNVGVIQ